jgi:hypothetical protein
MRPAPAKRRKFSGSLLPHLTLIPDWLTCGEPQPAFSMNERSALLWLAFDPAVKQWKAQPVEIDAILADGTRVSAIPDARVTFHNGDVVYREWKCKRDLAKPEVQQKLAGVAAYFRAQGQTYQVITDESLRPYADRIRNGLDLIGYRSDPPPDIDIESLFKSGIRQLLELVSVVGRQVALRLIAHERIVAELNAPLTPKSWIRPLKDADRASPLPIQASTISINTGGVQ